MKIRIIISLIVALSLSGCATANNPLTLGRLASLESAYGIALSAAVGYYELYRVRRCTTSAPFSPTNICAMRSVVVRLQQADIRAQAALQAARKFSAQNPTLDASAIINAAELAVSTFQQIERQNGITQ